MVHIWKSHFEKRMKISQKKFQCRNAEKDPNFEHYFVLLIPELWNTWTFIVKLFLVFSMNAFWVWKPFEEKFGIFHFFLKTRSCQPWKIVNRIEMFSEMKWSKDDLNKLILLLFVSWVLWPCLNFIENEKQNFDCVKYKKHFCYVCFSLQT